MNMMEKVCDVILSKAGSSIETLIRCWPVSVLHIFNNFVVVDSFWIGIGSDRVGLSGAWS